MNLVTSNLGKQYRRDFWGLKDFSLEVGPGILGLLGPNGAGKSTFMRMLATITKPTEGTITWNDTDIVKSPDTMCAVLGYQPQDFGVYPNLTAIEFLEYMAAIKGLNGNGTKKRIDELLQVVNLVEAAKRPLGGYSGGMKQRVGIAQALLNDPQLLIVDEPTVDLDPEERVRFRNLLSDLSGERIVILSTHIVSDVEATATRIVLINKGLLLREAAPEDLLKELDGKIWEWTVSSDDLTTLKGKQIVSGTICRSDGVQVRVVSESSPETNA
jgi:ABC-2 type transport system ATP-binding protein